MKTCDAQSQRKNKVNFFSQIVTSSFMYTHAHTHLQCEPLTDTYTHTQCTYVYIRIYTCAHICMKVCQMNIIHTMSMYGSVLNK